MLTKQEHYWSVCPVFGQSWLVSHWPALQALGCCWSPEQGEAEQECGYCLAALWWQWLLTYSSALCSTFSVFLLEQMEWYIKHSQSVILCSALVKKKFVWIDVHLQNNQICTNPTERPVVSSFSVFGGFWFHFSPVPMSTLIASMEPQQKGNSLH